MRLGESGDKMIKTMEEAHNFFEKRAIYGIKPGLARMRAMLARLEHPEQLVQAIHIAGTNGKGSTAKFMKDTLVAHDYEVGFFTSPSFSGLCGHFFKNNEQISEAVFLKYVQAVEPIVAELDLLEMYPTEFEILTTIAFLYFRDTVDFAVIETGMGGLEDTTNCFTPLVSVITNVSLDHVGFLGTTEAEIARHKAGIIKKERPVVIGEIHGEARKVIEEKAGHCESELFALGKEFSVEILEETEAVRFLNEGRELDVELEMRGQHQAQNAAVAWQTLNILEEKQIVILNDKILIESFNHAQLPGRFERILLEPPVVLDGAHNPAGIQTFIKTAKTCSNWKEAIVLFSGFGDKDLVEMIEELKKTFGNVQLTTFEHPRALRQAELKELARGQELNALPDWKKYVDEQVELNERPIFITGSLNFITQVREYLLG